MYVDTLPLAWERTKVYYNHDDVFFPETMTICGCHNLDSYGLDHTGLTVDTVVNRYVYLYWQGGIELLSMMLYWYKYTLYSDFYTDYLIPIADGIISFYYQHYLRVEEGKILFKPAQSLETWQDAVNPLPEMQD